MKLSYTTPRLQIDLISAEDLIRTSGESVIPDRAYFASGEQGVAEMLEDYVNQ